MRIPGSRLSLSARVLIGMGAGILTGIAAGHWVAPLEIVGDAFILLLQMPVLPYVAVSLVVSLGRLDYRTAGELALRGGALLLLLWVLSLAMVAVYPLTFPRWESAAFFSTSLVVPPAELSLLEMYIPANPFHSLASNMVPAVVLFSVVLGVALIGMDTKSKLLDTLDVVVKALAKVSSRIAELAPIGVFAISAHAAGTLAVEDLGRLQVYVISYVAVCMVMALWILPGLVASLTPLRYRDVVGPVRDVLVTAFATGNLFIVLPMLADRSHEVIKRCLESEEDEEEARRLVDVIVPTSFNFPNVGKLMTLTFVLYAGWYSGSDVALDRIPGFLLMGLFSFFGSIPMAMPFLLDQLTIPADMFQIYLVLNNLVNVRVGTLLSAMHIIVLSVLGAYVIMGRPIRWFKLVRWAAISLALTAGTIIGTRVTLENLVSHEYALDRVFEGMSFSAQYDPVMEIEGDPAPLPTAAGARRVEQIQERGFLRVGYLADALPYAYHNTGGELVGYDAEMARILAADLGVRLEFTKIERSGVTEALDAGLCDLVMSGMVKTPQRMITTQFSAPYQEQTLAFVVHDHRKDEFQSLADVALRRGLTIGVPDEKRYVEGAAVLLPQAEIVPFVSPRAYFRGREPELDAVVMTAEAGSAWCLIYPGFSVAVPRDRIVKAVLAYPVAQRDAEFAAFVSDWIEIKRMEGTLDSLFEHWILGRDATASEPRGALIDDWLGFGGDGE